MADVDGLRRILSAEKNLTPLALRYLRSGDLQMVKLVLEELMKRDKANLDIFWLKDKSLEDSDDLPDPDVLAQEIADDLQTALEQFTAIAEKVKG